MKKRNRMIAWGSVSNFKRALHVVGVKKVPTMKTLEKLGVVERAGRGRWRLLTR